mgnify:CR=1 FL=1
MIAAEPLGELLDGPHRHPERLRRASEEAYRTIFDTSNDAIYVHDLESGAILDANARTPSP